MTDDSNFKYGLEPLYICLYLGSTSNRLQSKTGVLSTMPTREMGKSQQDIRHSLALIFSISFLHKENKSLTGLSFLVIEFILSKIQIFEYD